MVNQRQLENVDYFYYLGSVITDDAGCTFEVKLRISMAKAAFEEEKKKKKKKEEKKENNNNNNNHLVTSHLELNIRKKKLV
jgi:hypothetical protein